MQNIEPDQRKIFIIDTSVLLYDARSIHSFPGNDIVIPLVVLDELDRKKEKPGLVGENARYVNRYLDDIHRFHVIKGSIEPSSFKYRTPLQT